MFEAVDSPDDRKPGRSPVGFTNERTVAASAETAWLLLTDPGAWLGFFPNVGHVARLDGHASG